MRGDRGARRSRTVREDWLAWIPNEMDHLFDFTRSDLETSNLMLSITLEEALTLCSRGRFDWAEERTGVFAGLFDRLAVRLRSVILSISDHGSHFGTLPNVEPLAASNFRGITAQRVSTTNALLAKVLFRQRTRFFHKLDSLDEIVASLQKQVHAQLEQVSEGPSQVRAWQELEVLSYDLNTCSSETTVILKSFFCALPPEELNAFQRKLISRVPDLRPVDSKLRQPVNKK